MAWGFHNGVVKQRLGGIIFIIASYPLPLPLKALNMNYLIDNILDVIIRKGAVKKDYPKKGVNFIVLEPFLNDPALRAKVAQLVSASINLDDFAGMAPIASRGYVFSGMITGINNELGEFPIQKVKAKGDPRYVQLEMKTEYSSDELQLLKNTVSPGGNYLVIDDLIATGGSVKTAVELIRQSGGVVDTVYVLTELVDFGARQALEKEGINLVSTLKFSNEDLDTLLHLQASYQEAPFAPLSYKLSHFEKGEQVLVKSNAAQPNLTVHLASQSPVKKELMELALKGLFEPLITQVNGHDSKSDVSEQPLGNETKQGASNRLKQLEENLSDLKGELLVSMESGIRYDEEKKAHYDFVHVMLKKGETIYEHTQDCCQIPSDIMLGIAKDEDDDFNETWGEAAKRMGRADEANNPHKEKEFGGVSRSTHLFKAACHVLGQFKEAMISPFANELDTHTFNMNRLVKLNDEKATDEYADMGINFSAEVAAQHSRPINFYNQGAPVQKWNIDANKIARNNFKVFQTGDAFSVMSPDVDVSGANITINAGLKHEKYSPLVLIQEALQLCRCAYEHGARSVTVALPEELHPVMNHTDFNRLLMDLFKASGVNNLYFYDDNYKGKLDETNRTLEIPLTLSEQGPKVQESAPYHISKRELREYLKLPNDLAQFKETTTSDDKMMHFTRRNQFKQLWAQFESDPKMDILNYLSDGKLLSKIDISDTKFRPHVVLCCSTNKPLAEKIAAYLRLQGEMVQLYAIDGQNDHASIPNEVRICGSVVTVVQSTHPSPNDVAATKLYKDSGASAYLFEAALIARQAHLRGAIRVNLINPYQFSARSDKAEDNVRGKTGAYVQQNGLLLKAAGVNQVITAECHDNHTMSGAYTSDTIRGSAVSALSVISARLAKEWLTDPKRTAQGQFRLVTPDAGAAKRTKELTQQLQVILGDKLCKNRVLGEKERSSHQDNSAEIKSLNAGEAGINPEHKHVLTDDETATGSTLCQAITGLKRDGAKDVSVIVVHNNLPLDWLLRQLCLARFLYLGVNDLHFSDTNEMGSMPYDYNDLLDTYARLSKLSYEDVERQVSVWFHDEITKKYNVKMPEVEDSWLQSMTRSLLNFFGVNSEIEPTQEEKAQAMERKAFTEFKSTFGQFESKISIHSLADEFANKVTTKPYMSNPYAFNHKVDTLINQIRSNDASSVVVFEGASLPAASAAAHVLGLPLQVLPLSISDRLSNQCLLPNKPFALLGTASEKILNALASMNGHTMADLLPKMNQGFEGDLVIVSSPALTAIDNEKKGENQNVLKIKSNDFLIQMERLCDSIKKNEEYKGVPIKLLGLGVKGQAIAGQLSHALSKQGFHVGIAAIERQGEPSQYKAVYSGQSGECKLTVDRNSVGMGEVCIVIANELTMADETAVKELISNAEVKCPFDFLLPRVENKSMPLSKDKMTEKNVCSAKTSGLFFQPNLVSRNSSKSAAHDLATAMIDVPATASVSFL